MRITYSVFVRGVKNMQECKAGELLKCFRLEKGISRKKLGYGVCSENTLSNYEIGNREIDILLLEFFLQRMGVSEENFALMLTEEEYVYYTWKSEVYEAIEIADWDTLEKLLQKKEARFPVGKDEIQEQFYAYMYAILEAEKYAHYEIATAYLDFAIRQTMGSEHDALTKCVYLSVQELHIILLYLHYGLYANKIKKTTAEQRFHELKTYILDGQLDTIEKCKIYPKMICVWMKHQDDIISNQENKNLCERGISILKEGMQFNDIVELLRIYIPLLENDSEQYLFYQKQKEVFEELFVYAEMEERFRPEYIVRKIPKVYVITEYLKNKRMEQKLTQNQISEGICEPETYSRIETGKRAPSKSNRKALLNKLNVGWYYFRGELQMHNLEAYGLRRKYRKAEIEGRWQEVYDMLQEMKVYLDMESIINRQSIFSAESRALYQLNLITAEDYYNKLQDALYLTVNVDVEKDTLIYYTQTELEIIGEIGKILRKLGKLEEAVRLLEQVLQQMSQSKVPLKFHWNGVGFIKRVLAGVYFSKEMYAEGYELRKTVYEIEVRERDGANLPNLLDGMADDLEHIGEQYKETYMLLYRLTYYVSDFYEINKIRDFAKGYYEKFELNYRWY